MPVSASSSTAIYQALKDADVRIVSALPETWLVHLITAPRKLVGGSGSPLRVLAIVPAREVYNAGG